MASSFETTLLRLAMGLLAVLAIGLGFGLHSLNGQARAAQTKMDSLKAKKVTCGPVKEERWGSLTTISLPGGGKIGLYEPKHPTAIGR